MKLCVNARQEIEYLKMANEIFFQYKDREVISDYIEKYPDKIMILDCPGYNLEWEKFQEWNKEKIIYKIYNVTNAIKCQEYGLQFFFGYFISSYDELTAALAMGSQYVNLAAPLFFDMDHIKQSFPDIQIRITPNIAYHDLYSREDGVTGTWIRPEDIMMYDEFVSVMEFECTELSQERALIRIYLQDRAWPGDLELIIPDINYAATNRMLSSDLTEKRLNCRQVCKSGKHCHICYRFLDLADPELIRDYKESIEPKYQAPKNND